MKRLENKTALITGAARGIGRGFAKAYVREAATVAIAAGASSGREVALARRDGR